MPYALETTAQRMFALCPSLFYDVCSLFSYPTPGSRIANARYASSKWSTTAVQVLRER